MLLQKASLHHLAHQQSGSDIILHGANTAAPISAKAGKHEHLLLKSTEGQYRQNPAVQASEWDRRARDWHPDKMHLDWLLYLGWLTASSNGTKAPGTIAVRPSNGAHHLSAEAAAFSRELFEALLARVSKAWTTIRRRISWCCCCRVLIPTSSCGTCSEDQMQIETRITHKASQKYHMSVSVVLNLTYHLLWHSQGRAWRGQVA